MEPHFKTIGDLRITNTLLVKEDDTAHDAAMLLLESGFQGMSVFDERGKICGKITEMDLLKSLKAGRDLKTTRVGEIMAPPPPVVDTETPLEEAIELMDTHHLIRLPAMRGSRFIGNVTRHDLLRAWMGVWLDHGRGNYVEVFG